LSASASGGRYTVAVVQHPPAFLDLEGSVDRAVELIGEAAGDGAKLVVFGETWLPGYPVWIFGAAGWDDAAAKRAHARLVRNSVEVGSGATDRLAAAARRHRVHVVMGCNERDTEFSRGTIYNSILTFSDAGELLGVHRKLWPTHAERLVWGLGDGSGLIVHDTPLGRVGGLVCWEHWMPLARFAMHALGEQVHCALWPDVVESHRLASRYYAFEGRCYVVCAGSYLAESDIPADFEAIDALPGLGAAETAAGVLLPGGSGIIGPDGEWVAGPLQNERGIVYGEVDLDRIAEEQLAFDAAGHYNRPDVFEVRIDTRPRPQATFVRPEEQPAVAAEGGPL
jgi:predicted amidohydrolase